MLQRILLLALTIGLLAALFVWLRPDDEGASTDAADARSASPAQRFDYRVDAEGQVDGPEVARVQQGQQVSLHITTAQDDEAHLHGYDIAQDITAGQTGVLRFHADTAGRFTLELHDAHQRIGVLEVLPR